MFAPGDVQKKSHPGGAPETKLYFFLALSQEGQTYTFTDVDGRKSGPYKCEITTSSYNLHTHAAGELKKMADEAYEINFLCMFVFFLFLFL